MVATATRPVRRNTYARFEAACRRATERGIRVLSYRNGRAIVSASNGRDAYFVSPQRCSCAASATYGDRCCLHAAAVFLHEQALWDAADRQGEPA